ncbi:MAG: ketose-bisphosphate aldolase [Sphingobacteriales bacterium 50-39]|mgnify:CR=1 FL=1|nr:class II fructose-bisphosphate aldolase [Sphingobacteriales bacterium]OJW55895.1 MAG: ketose-bisphosphate aldolase [Sphingobacteriales bacterium 50-39]
MLLKDKLLQCSLKGEALLATNFYNFETLSGVLMAARQKSQPLILQLSESSIDYMGLKVAAGLGKCAMEQYGVRAWLHLDHGGSVDMVRRCLDAGFDSVMIDASEKPFAENVRITSEVVKIAARYNVNVEAELGYVAKLGQAQVTGIYTQPDEARRFVEATGINALAVAIGSAHGFYTEPPNLQLELLFEIHRATPCALVLHGSSGIPDEQIRRAIKNGIAKINLATEIKNVFMKSLKKVLVESPEIDLRKVFPRGTASVTELITGKLEVIAG